jgi:hypothetical protein
MPQRPSLNYCGQTNASRRSIWQSTVNPNRSRNRLGEAFIADVYAKWTERGPAALDALIEQDPGGFVRVVAGLMPKEMIVKDDLTDVSDEELAFIVYALREVLLEQAAAAEANLN